MRVVHITPTYFADASLIGGGERYVTELSKRMAKRVDTTLVSFSSNRRTLRLGDLKVEIFPVQHLIDGSTLNPLSVSHLARAAAADVVHLHQIYTVVSDLSCVVASLLRKKVFVTDYGGGGRITLNRWLPIFALYRGAVAYSQFGVECLPPRLRGKATLVKGGIDPERFQPRSDIRKERTILFVGRLLPHKGINYLIDAFRLLARRDYRLRIVGRVHDQAFYDYLKDLAAGQNVEFIHDADDDRLVAEYQAARVTVLPSVHRTYDGGYSSLPELMGFTLLESQACGTPVVCTDAGAMPEFVADKRTGFVVRQNSAEALAEGLNGIIGASDVGYAEFQRACRELVMPLSWDRVLDQYLALYESS